MREGKTEIKRDRDRERDALKKENAKVVRGLPSGPTLHYTTQTAQADYKSDLENLEFT